jgi:acetylornithine deacetylase/succinyl-diaminopimelate desuccinylase-like protein
MSLRSKALEYSKNNYDFYQGILQDFIEIPSISTDPIRKPNMLEAANFIKNILNQFGI